MKKKTIEIRGAEKHVLFFIFPQALTAPDSSTKSLSAWYLAQIDFTVDSHPITHSPSLYVCVRSKMTPLFRQTATICAIFNNQNKFTLPHANSRHTHPYAHTHRQQQQQPNIGWCKIKSLKWINKYDIVWKLDIGRETKKKRKQQINFDA